MQLIKFGDILSVDDGLIVHGCNAQGIMGAGVALQIKQQFPQVYEDYRAAYDTNGLRLGKIFTTWIDYSRKHGIVNAITQQHIGRAGKLVSYEAIYDVFWNVGQLANQNSVCNIHYPLIGSGLGGGDWSIIQECIHSALGAVNYGGRKTLWLLSDK